MRRNNSLFSGGEDDKRKVPTALIPLLHPVQLENETQTLSSLIDEIEKRTKDTGNENQGFLSRSHGLMPKLLPETTLGPNFKELDYIGTRMPQLQHNGALRTCVDKLPLYDMSKKFLDDRGLMRAGVLLANIAHAYWWCEMTPPPAGKLPDVILLPWAQVRERLDRPADAVAANAVDLIGYNWYPHKESLTNCEARMESLPAGSTAGKDLSERQTPNWSQLRVETLKQLVPSSGGQSESMFWCVLVEMLATCTPMIQAMEDIEQVVFGGESLDPNQLIDPLGRIGDCLRRATWWTLPKLAYRALDEEHYMENVSWSNTLSRFVVPFVDGTHGPSGGSVPIFTLMDAFVNRERFSTLLGREIKFFELGFPSAWRRAISAVGRLGVCLQRYISKHSSSHPTVEGYYKQVLELYAGKGGLFDRHRLKIFGFTEMAFKLGRARTAGGFAGKFNERSWDVIDTEVQLAANERRTYGLTSWEMLQVEDVECIETNHTSTMLRVTIDSKEWSCNNMHIPGDHVDIHVPNLEEQVNQIVNLFVLNGVKRLAVGVSRKQWQHVFDSFQIPLLQVDCNDSDTAFLQLEDLLKVSEINVLSNRCLKLLLQSGGCSEQVIFSVEQKKLSLLQVLDRYAFAPRSKMLSLERIVQALEPIRFRTFTIAETGRNSIGLLIACAPDGGSVAKYLQNHERNTKNQVLVRLARSCVLVPFEDPRCESIVNSYTMIAGGTGIAPFMRLLETQVTKALVSNDKPVAKHNLFLSVRYKNQFECILESADCVIKKAFDLGILNFFAVCTSDEMVFSTTTWELELRKTPKRALELFASLESRLVLTNAIHSACQYLERRDTPDLSNSELKRFKHTVMFCGSPELCVAMKSDLKRLLLSNKTFASNILERLEANGLVRDETFTRERQLPAATDPKPMFYESTESNTTTTLNNLSQLKLNSKAAKVERLITIPELVEHDMMSGTKDLWLLVGDYVYNVSSFAQVHPGGHQTLEAYAGCDATAAFFRCHGPAARMAVSRGNTLVVGRVVLPPSSNETTDNTWVQALFNVVELSNAWEHARSIKDVGTVDDENHDGGCTKCWFKLQRRAAAVYKCASLYLAAILETVLPRVLQATGMEKEISILEEIRNYLESSISYDTWYVNGLLTTLSSDTNITFAEDFHSKLLRSVKSALVAGVRNRNVKARKQCMVNLFVSFGDYVGNLEELVFGSNCERECLVTFREKLCMKLRTGNRIRNLLKKIHF